MSNPNETAVTNDSPDMLIDVYGGKNFFKVYQALEIGKMKFSFVNKEDPKGKHIDIYVDADVFSCDLIEQIKNGELRQKGNAERKRAKEEKAQYCKSIWDYATKNGQLSMQIQPGNNTEFVFYVKETIEQGDEKKNTSITVGCDYRSLRLMAERWSFLKADYDDMMRRKYSLVNMQNGYRKGNKATASAPSSTPVQKKEQPESSPAVTQQIANSVTDKPAPAVASQAKPIGLGVGATSQAPATTVPQEEKPQNQEFRMKTTTPIADIKNGNGKMALKAITNDNRTFSVIFPAELCKHSDFSNFEKRCSRVGSVIKIRGTIGTFADTDAIFVTGAM